jgi:hypothetical protein
MGSYKELNHSKDKDLFFYYPSIPKQVSSSPAEPHLTSNYPYCEYFPTYLAVTAGVAGLAFQSLSRMAAFWCVAYSQRRRSC